MTLDTEFRSVITYWPDQETTKDVVYFAAEAVENAIIPQLGEVIRADWFSKQDALTLLTFENDRKLLQSVLDYLKA